VSHCYIHLNGHSGVKDASGHQTAHNTHVGIWRTVRISQIEARSYGSSQVHLVFQFLGLGLQPIGKETQQE